MKWAIFSKVENGVIYLLVHNGEITRGYIYSIVHNGVIEGGYISDGTHLTEHLTVQNEVTVWG